MLQYGKEGSRESYAKEKSRAYKKVTPEFDNPREKGLFKLVKATKKRTGYQEQACVKDKCWFPWR